MSNIVWRAELDNGQYICKVTRLSSYTGQLTVENTADSNTILDKEVCLSYGAQFGPDVEDVAQWQEMIIEAVDNL